MNNKKTLLLLIGAGLAVWYFILNKKPAAKQTTSPLTPRPSDDNSISPTKPQGAGGTNSQAQKDQWLALNNGALTAGGIDLTPLIRSGASAVSNGISSAWSWLTGGSKPSPTADAVNVLSPDTGNDFSNVTQGIESTPSSPSNDGIDFGDTGASAIDYGGLASRLKKPAKAKKVANARKSVLKKIHRL